MALLNWEFVSTIVLHGSHGDKLCSSLLHLLCPNPHIYPRSIHLRPVRPIPTFPSLSQSLPRSRLSVPSPCFAALSVLATIYSFSLFYFLSLFVWKQALMRRHVNLVPNAILIQRSWDKIHCLRTRGITAVTVSLSPSSRYYSCRGNTVVLDHATRNYSRKHTLQGSLAFPLSIIPLLYWYQLRSN